MFVIEKHVQHHVQHAGNKHSGAYQNYTDNWADILRRMRNRLKYRGHVKEATTLAYVNSVNNFCKANRMHVLILKVLFQLGYRWGHLSSSQKGDKRQ